MREIVVDHWLVRTLRINRDFYKYPVSLRVVKRELKPTIVTKKIKIMAVERTLTILKPDCVRKNLIGEVTRRIQEAGFKIELRMLVKMANSPFICRFSFQNKKGRSSHFTLLS
jgi:hypothetical protein